MQKHQSRVGTMTLTRECESTFVLDALVVAAAAVNSGMEKQLGPRRSSRSYPPFPCPVHLLSS